LNFRVSSANCWPNAPFASPWEKRSRNHRPTAGKNAQEPDSGRPHGDRVLVRNDALRPDQGSHYLSFKLTCWSLFRGAVTVEPKIRSARLASRLGVATATRAVGSRIGVEPDALLPATSTKRPAARIRPVSSRRAWPGKARIGAKTAGGREIAGGLVHRRRYVVCVGRRILPKCESSEGPTSACVCCQGAASGLYRRDVIDPSARERSRWSRRGCVSASVGQGNRQLSRLRREWRGKAGATPSRA